MKTVASAEYSTFVRMDSGLHRRLKIYCRRHGRVMSQFVARLVAAELDLREELERKPSNRKPAVKSKKGVSLE
jgi:hypothetical protein